MSFFRCLKLGPRSCRYGVAGACGLALLIGMWSPALADDLSPARALLGDVVARLVVVDKANGGRLYLLDVNTGVMKEVSKDLVCSYPEVSPDGNLLVYTRGKELVVRQLDTGTVVRVFTGYHGRWWIDSQGQMWIYYSSTFAGTTWPGIGKGVSTWRLRLKDGHKEKLLDWKTTAGPSQDGSRVASDYISLVLFELPGGKATPLNGGERGCYASISPDNTYWVMHLDIGHDRLLVHNAQDRLVLWAAMPKGFTYVNQPHWSTDPDLAVLTARETPGVGFSVFLVRLSALDPKTGRARLGATAMVRLLSNGPGSHDWATPFLWVAPLASLDAGGSSPLDAGVTKDAIWASDLSAPVVSDGGCSLVVARGTDGVGLLFVLLGGLIALRARAPSQSCLTTRR